MTEILKPLRKKIDSLDAQISAMLAAREKIVLEVAKIKEDRDIDVVLPERIREVIDTAATNAVKHGGSDGYTRAIYERIIELSCALEEDKIKK